MKVLKQEIQGIERLHGETKSHTTKDSLRNPFKGFKIMKTTVQGISSEDDLAMKIIFKLRYEKT